MFYISRIRLVNVTCFRGETIIDLTHPSRDEPSWTLILGDNGTGKTSLLRSIAMCLCDETAASGLLTELTGPFISHGCDEATIELVLKSDEGTDYTITTTLTQTDSTTEEVKQEIKPSGFPRAKLFACGYGAAFGTTGSEVYEKYRLIDAVYTLFNYAARLQNPENALFRVSHAGIPLKNLLAKIDRVLMLPVGSTRLDSSGLKVEGPWGEFVPVGAMSDGYASVIAWICDLIGWSLLASGKSAVETSVRGIVLRDEIEQHLHPSWQKAIVGLLARDFPGVQFIATTHAPLTAIGSTKLLDECCQLVLLQHSRDGREGVTVQSGLKPPRGRRADQVLTSYLFGLPTTSSDDVIQAIERYSLLRQVDSPDDVTRQEIEDLRRQLAGTLGTPETPLQRRVERAVHDTLAQMVGATPQAPHLDALTYETRRQLRELFGSKGQTP